MFKQAVERPREEITKVTSEKKVKKKKKLLPFGHPRERPEKKLNVI